MVEYSMTPKTGDNIKHRLSKGNRDTHLNPQHFIVNLSVKVYELLVRQLLIQALSEEVFAQGSIDISLNDVSCVGVVSMSFANTSS